ILESTPPGAGGEIQVTDALETLREQSGVQAYRMQGTTYDCGQPLGYLEATLAYARRHPEFGEAFQTLLSRYHQGE
ncbi:MAG TPA: UTP--glucose-1-phosphate uridylyltransferase, partial [Halomonas sp.]|nr:UTP--glucose-1-phosphate uridylyltransferase [Halomonas sp.]